jgi:hypothetical protein
MSAAVDHDMASNDYCFLTRWTADAPVEDVYTAMINGMEYVRWWPQVYLAVHETNPGGEHGIGKAADLHTKGRLPYTLHWRMKVIETNYPLGFTISAEGDFVGRGVWTFRPEDERVEIDFDWRLRAEKGLIRRLSFLFKPLFAYNHRWAMARGQEGLREELKRIRQKAAGITASPTRS